MPVIPFLIALRKCDSRTNLILSAQDIFRLIPSAVTPFASAGFAKTPLSVKLLMIDRASIFNLTIRFIEVYHHFLNMSIGKTQNLSLKSVKNVKNVFSKENRTGKRCEIKVSAIS